MLSTNDVPVALVALLRQCADEARATGEPLSEPQLDALCRALYPTVDDLHTARRQVEAQRDRLALAEADGVRAVLAAHLARTSQALRRITAAYDAGDMADVRARIAAARQLLDAPHAAAAGALRDLERLAALRSLLRAVVAYERAVERAGLIPSLMVGNERAVLSAEISRAQLSGLLEGIGDA